MFIGFALAVRTWTGTADRPLQKPSHPLLTSYHISLGSKVFLFGFVKIRRAGPVSDDG
jgi:hypothetical protein